MAGRLPNRSPDPQDKGDWLKIAAFLGLLIVPALAWAQTDTSGLYAGGAEPCRLCHARQFASFAGTKMGALFLRAPRDAREARACEACHGPAALHAASAGAQHADSFIAFTKRDPSTIAQRNAVCLDCHAHAPVALWRGSAHDNRNVACVDCHSVHGGHQNMLAEASQQQLCTRCHQQIKSALMKTSHHPLREEKLACTSCHNPHGTPSDRLIAANSVNDLCYGCHAEKRGPFLFEHPPARESCLNCHEPHGSSHRPMLVMAAPLLCQRCHSNANHPSLLLALNAPDAQAGRSVYTANAQLFYRACANCHVQVHGTNHPSGVFFHR